MVPPLAGRSLIPHRKLRPLCHGGVAGNDKEAAMTIKLVALVLLCLMTGTAVAEEPKVTPLMSRDRLADFAVIDAPEGRSTEAAIPGPISPHMHL